jgi:hypothetical protein
MAAHWGPALALAQQIVEFANRQSDPTYRLLGYRLLGMTQVFSGQHRDALQSLSNTAVPRSRSCSAIGSRSIPASQLLVARCGR